MFDIGWTELLIIAVVAIIVVGPKDLPGMLRTLGQYAGKLKRTAGEFREQFDDALRDSELEELRSELSEMGDMNPVNQIRDSVTESLDPLKDFTSGMDDIGGSGDDSGTPAKEAEASPKSSETEKASKPAKAKKAAGKATPRKKAAGKATPRKKAAKKPAAGKKSADTDATQSEG